MYPAGMQQAGSVLCRGRVSAGCIRPVLRQILISQIGGGGLTRSNEFFSLECR